jgi:hypothetical protein
MMMERSFSRFLPVCFIPQLSHAWPSSLRAGVLIAIVAVGGVALSGCGKAGHSASAGVNGISTTVYNYNGVVVTTSTSAQAGCPETFIAEPGKIIHVRRLPLALAERCEHAVADPHTSGLIYRCRPHEEDRLCPYPTERRTVGIYTTNAKLLGYCTPGESSERPGDLLCTEEPSAPGRPHRVGVYTIHSKLLGHCSSQEQPGTFLCTEPLS